MALDPNMLRQQDFDRYLTWLYAPARARPALLALYTLNLELANSVEQTHEPMLGEIRLAWWREGIARAYAGNQSDTPHAHPLLQAIADAIVPTKLPQAWLEELIVARLSDVYHTRFATLADLCAYLDQSAGQLMQAAVYICDTHTPKEGLAAASALGRAWGLVGLLRAVVYHARQQRFYLPTASLQDADAAAQSLLSDALPPALKPILQEMAASAQGALSHSRSLSLHLSRAARTPMLLGVLAQDYLKRIQQQDYALDTLEKTPSGQFIRQVKLACAALLWRY
jgi:NADH dehydrogenase [ubiquinone] 1 alpha subcomplex assembly factor 6